MSARSDDYDSIKIMPRTIEQHIYLLLDTLPRKAIQMPGKVYRTPRHECWCIGGRQTFRRIWNGSRALPKVSKRYVIFEQLLRLAIIANVKIVDPFVKPVSLVNHDVIGSRQPAQR
jgi:hypothetical protein